ncbi:MAG: clostripain-related cysteine peptidase [Elusimicrobiales bacterium]|nr:clostripain-related cysteine peptidase [Elusimicrobiales bacterium]
MIIFIKILVLSLFIPSAPAAAAPFALDSMNAAEMSAAPVPVPEAVIPDPAGKPVPAEWTVMVYSTTRDQLRYSLLWQLLEMKRVGSSEKVRVVAQATMPFLKADGSVSTDTVRIALGGPAAEGVVDAALDKVFSGGQIDESALEAFGADIVWRAPAGDTGDWRAAADFTRWASAAYPAPRRAFVIYGHGNGFFDAKKQPAQKGTLMDTETGNYVTLPELRELMRATGRVDAFVMTSCIMQMAEVAWQVKDHADVVVGSSELMYALGYDMGGMLGLLNSDPAVPSADLGRFMAAGYVERAKAFERPGAHASVLDTSALDELGRRVRAWVEAETAFDNHKAENAGIKGAARFDIFGVTMATDAPHIAAALSVSGDLYDFVRIVAEKTPRDIPAGELAVARANELMSFISDDLFHGYYQYGTSPTGFPYARTHGISAHVPPVRLIGGSLEGFMALQETDYWTLPFAAETGWGPFIRRMYSNYK